MNLNDEELLEAIKLAREYAQRENVSFDIALKATSELVAEKKNEEVVTTLKEEPTPAMTDENLKEFMKSNYDKMAELRNRAYTIDGNSRYSVTLRQHVALAEKGGLKNDFFADPEARLFHGMAPDITPDSRNEYKNCLNELNSLARENYYAFYRMSSDEVIEKDRLTMIKMYQNLKAVGAETKQQVESKGLWNNSAATITVRGDIERFEKQNCYHEVAIESFVSNEQMQSTSYPSHSYDITYYYTKGRLMPSAHDFYNKRMFEEAEQLVDERIQELQRMSTIEYRNYKINQMKLTEEEKTMFEAHINEYMATKEKGHIM